MSHKTYHQYRFRAREALRGARNVTQSPEAIRAKSDLAYFGEYVADKKAMPHHLAWLNELVTGESNSALNKIVGNDTAILSPRGSAKSTWIGLFVAWVIGHNPAIQIIYCSYSENVALSRSRLIQRIIQSDRYRQVFPNILPGSRWSATDWEIDKDFCGLTGLEADYTFLAVGAAGSITSKRSSLIIIDDPVKSSESIDNPEVREKLETNWVEVLRPTLIPGGRVIAIGTRFRADDLFGTIFTKARGWNVIEQSAIVLDDTGEEQSYWAERYPIEELQELREMSPVSFSFQFQNKIVRISETSIDPAWILKGDVPTDANDYDALVIGIDLSSSLKERADYTVFTLVGRKGNQYYVLDGRRFRATGNIEKFNTLIEMWEDWGCPYVRVLVESVAYQLSFAGDFRTFVIEQEGIHEMTCTPVPVKGDKLQRLRGVTGLFENKLVTFNQYRKLGMWVEELTNFGSSTHDDTVDSLVLALQGIISRGRLEVG